MRESPRKTTWLVNLFCFDSLCIHSTVLKILCGKAETKQQISIYLLNNANQVFSIVCESSEYSNWGPVEHKWRAKSVKNSVTFARSSVERHANIKINESQVFSMRDAFIVASRGQFISRVHVQLNINSLQNFGFSEHPRKLPKALTRVITEIDVPIGKTARSQYVDFHTSCESPHKNGYQQI